MKTINYIFFVLLTTAIAFVSCSKAGMQTSPTAKETILSAEIEQIGTKTGMSGATEGSENVSVVWTAGDKLSILSGSSYGINNEFTLKSGSEGKSVGSFSGASISGNIVAVYPYSANVAYSSNKVTLEIPQTQAYTDGTFAQNSVPMVSVGEVGSPLSLKYLFSAIAFKVNGSGENVTKVTVVATKPLWGPAEISGLDGTPSITLTGTDSKYKAVELTCSTAQDISSDKVFYIAVPSGEYSFAVNVYCSDGTIFHESYASAKTFNIGRIKYNSSAKAFSDNGPAYIEGSYFGEGTKIDNVWWAPVNCGYDTDHTYGLLYQWGRKYGQAYEGGNITPISTLTKGEEEETGGQLVSNAGKFGSDNYPDAPNWFAGEVDNTLWNDTGKGKYDPCPPGWRVPTKNELGGLIQNHSDWISSGQNGCYFSGSVSYTESVQRVFLSAAGCFNLMER